MGKRDVSRVAAERAYTPNQIPSSPLLQSSAFPHAFPLMFWFNIQISLLFQPFLFQCLEHFQLETLRLPRSSPLPQSQLDSLLLYSSLLPTPHPTHLQLSDGHDLLPSQFHLTQLRSGQLCHPVPALLGRTRRHPTGPGPGPGSPKAQMAPATCIKGEMGVRAILLGVSNFVLPVFTEKLLPMSPERRRDLIPSHSRWTHQPTP